jgi:ribulose 1,5-bisphosphate carboxylase large subunit-like protein
LLPPHREYHGRLFGNLKNKSVKHFNSSLVINYIHRNVKDVMDKKKELGIQILAFAPHKILFGSGL